jgi:hypothetical protein
LTSVKAGAKMIDMPDPKPTRRFQFSLRTLLVVVTLCAVASSTWVGRKYWLSERLREAADAMHATLVERAEQLPSLVGERVLVAGKIHAAPHPKNHVWLAHERFAVDLGESK